MKKIFTLLVCALAFTMAMAQPTATIKKTSTAPVIDGTVDDVWSTVDPIALEVPFTGENPTVGNSWWKMMWDDQGIYLLTFVDDDKFVPAYKGTVPGESWNYDKLEIYFDCNYEKKDGVGPSASGSGHYQIAPTVKEALLEGGPTTESRGEVWAFNASDDPKYYAEYFFPFSMLNDKSGNPVEKTEPIGFDVNIMDNDRDDLTPSRARMEWANDGSAGENWSNMDNAGLIILEGATPGIDISSLAISGATEITTDNGTIQLTAAVTPADATQIYKWKVTNGTGMATISSTGLLTGLRNGTVTVQAVSSDEFVSSNELTINISGQKISLDEVNLLKNSLFTNGADGKENWGGNGTVENNYYNLECTPKAQIWDNMFGQQHVPVADATTKYIVRFKAKGSNDMAVPMLFEDRANGNDKVQSSSVAYRDNSYGKWDVPVTVEEKTFDIDVVFSNKKDNSDYELNFQAGMVSGTFSLSNIMMFREADLALVDPTAGLQTMDENSIKVYPNPVGNATEITVNLVNAKGNVAVYNALGQRIMEKSATGNTVKFDVSGLQKGLYFVKTSEGATQKFIR